MSQSNQCYHQSWEFADADMGSADGIRQLPETEGWKAYVTASLPLGFSADRMTTYAHLDGVVGWSQDGDADSSTEGDSAPAEAVIQVRLSRNNTRWTPWIHMAWYGRAEEALAELPKEERAGVFPETPKAWSAGGDYPNGIINDDELVAGSNGRFRFIQLRALTRGGAQFVRLGLAAMALGDPGWTTEDPTAIPADLPSILMKDDFPHIAQFDVPEIGGEICSPTSVLMSLRALGLPGGEWSPTEAAKRCLDHRSGIFGNWTRNAQLAWEGGARLRLEYFESMKRVVDELAAGHPVVASLKFKKGELTNAPCEWSGGHLCLVIGYDAETREVLCSDSAQKAGAPHPHRYKVEEIAKIWLETRGLGYIIEPA